jgi:preprotein translocase subunit SecB
MKKEQKQVLEVTAQYMRDLSFENANPFSQIENTDKSPQIDVQLRVDVEKGKTSNSYKVSLVVKAQAKLDKPLFILELNYTGEFVVDGFPEDMLEPILYIECPRLLFPFVRSIIANTVSDGGFAPLYIAPINFVDLYQQQKESANQTLQ